MFHGSEGMAISETGYPNSSNGSRPEKEIWQKGARKIGRGPACLLPDSAFSFSSRSSPLFFPAKARHRRRSLRNGAADLRHPPPSLRPASGYLAIRLFPAPSPARVVKRSRSRPGPATVQKFLPPRTRESGADGETNPCGSQGT